ncbi:predicted protein [Plenodomus lingam JN3]|uniref:Predicted protein n=1 Tax=Leptosphaeria maculans (strain JN3 / isolate v23.1.3 / race Av1-4-5-6-7-8) TaxID=985895 RepID=E4ZLU6_LEPMJ|nr:predicted protein [Plenodomus lingam JN3]CBX92776.1 predicted protein [Plenodomus lingam JN3]
MVISEGGCSDSLRADRRRRRVSSDRYHPPEFFIRPQQCILLHTYSNPLLYLGHYGRSSHGIPATGGSSLTVTWRQMTDTFARSSYTRLLSRVSNADLDGIDVVTDPSHVRKATADLSRGFRPRPGLPTCSKSGARKRNATQGNATQLTVDKRGVGHGEPKSRAWFVSGRATPRFLVLPGFKSGQSPRPLVVLVAPGASLFEIYSSPG